MQTLRNSGYCWVSLPDNQIAPLQLLQKKGNGEAEQLNAIVDEIFISEMPLPIISNDIDLPADIAGEELLNLKIETQFSFLKNLIRVFTDDACAHFNYDKNNTAKFSLVEPKRNSIGIIKLDKYIQNAKPDKMAKSAVEALENNEIYVITDIIKAKGIVLETTGENSVDAGVKVPTTVVDAGADVDYKKTKKEILNHSGGYLTVAVKACRIYYDKPGWFRSDDPSFHIQSEELSIFKSVEEYPASLLQDDIVSISPAPPLII